MNLINFGSISRDFGIFFSPGDSKLTHDGLGFEWNWERKTFWTLTFELLSRNSKLSVQKVFLCAFHSKRKLSKVSLGSPGLENVPQFPGNQPEVCQNHDARKAVSATLWVWRWSRVIFRSRSSKVSVQKVFVSQFHWKPRPSWVSLESPGVENIF